MTKCLRCGADSSWIQGQAPCKARDEEIAELRDEVERSQRALKLISVDYDQRCHDMKQLRQHMGCDGSDLEQLCAAWDAKCQEVERLQRVIRFCFTVDQDSDYDTDVIGHQLLPLPDDIRQTIIRECEAAER